MLLSLAAAALAVPATVPVAADLTRDGTEWVLSGDNLPDDYLQRLADLPPDQRLMTIVFLRRAGLLTGATLPVETLLARPSPPVAVGTRR